MSRARVLGRVYAADDGSPLAALGVPLLAFFARHDIGGISELATLRANATAAPTVQTAVLAGGDHVYTDAEDETARLLAGWLRTIS